MHTININHTNAVAQRDNQKNLDAAKLVWSKKGLEDYTFTQSISCFCIPDYTKPYTYEVKNGAVVEDADNEGEFAPDLLTVE